MIIGDRIYLRAVEVEDLDLCWRWVNDPEVTRYMLLGGWPISRLAEREWLERAARGTGDRDRQMAVCLRGSDRHIGNCGLHQISWRSGTADLGIVIGEKDCWDQGCGRDAVRTVLRHAFREMSLRKVTLSVLALNHRAIRCYEQCGFAVEGILRGQHLVDGLHVDEVRMAVFAPGR
ncbi:MAG: GNAT family N-acetyltransferase [Bacillota bacterium]|nr:GNAT family N-acetyltransferase [Bacillota bacterium]